MTKNTTTDPPHNVANCKIQTLSADGCSTLLSWLQGQTREPSGFDDLRWALTYSVDGVTWGRCDKEDNQRIWRLSSEVVPEVCPNVRFEALEEIRMFGDKTEVLMWKSGGELRGRVICETEQTDSNRDTSKDSLCPSDESRILRGDSVWRECNNDFTYICDSSGCEQVLPMRIQEETLRSRDARLVVRNYFEKLASGAVRVAATRLVRLQNGLH